MREARVVITHAGVGSVIASLTAGKRPIVVPRKSCFGEIVDDHQVVFARRLGERELVDVVEDPARLPEAIARHGSAATVHRAQSSSLEHELERWIDEALRTPGSRRRHRR
jgi:UDP-N-acetylglucosamine transferase subunit ALG13